MTYNLEQFGKIFQALRKAKHLSYNRLSETSGVAKNTLRNIERGNVLPNLETLFHLSNYLNADLPALLVTCKKDRHTEFDKIKAAYEVMISAHKTDQLLSMMSSIEALLSKDDTPLRESRLEQRILQLYYKMIGHYETYVKKDDKAALKAFLKALKVTLPDFRLATYQQVNYNYDELHILFNIAQMQARQHPEVNDTLMYEFIYQTYEALPETEIHLFPLLMNNLAVTHLNIGNDEKALHYVNIGLRYLDKNQVIIDMPSLLLCKGIILTHICDPHADLYINLCFDLLLLSNRPELLSAALKQLNEVYHIDYKPKLIPFKGPVNTTKQATK